MRRTRERQIVQFHSNTQQGRARQMRASRSLLLLAAVVCLPGIGGAEPSQTRKQDFTVTVRVIGILPTVNSIDGSEAGTKLLDERLAERLRAAGFEVREVARYQAVETEARQVSGGWFDPFTGRVDKYKRDRALDGVMGAYQLRNGVDAFLRAQI